MVMRERSMPTDTFVLKRGLYDKPDKASTVAREVPKALGALPAGEEDAWPLARSAPRPTRLNFTRADVPPSALACSWRSRLFRSRRRPRLRSRSSSPM
jgi:hypothetical protein